MRGRRLRLPVGSSPPWTGQSASSITVDGVRAARVNADISPAVHATSKVIRSLCEISFQTGHRLPGRHPIGDATSRATVERVIEARRSTGWVTHRYLARPEF